MSLAAGGARGSEEQRKRAAAAMPINSNMKTHASAIDIVLLVICLLVPFVMYPLIQLREHRQAKAEALLREQGRLSGAPRRLSSTYEMDPQPANVSLLPLQAASPKAKGSEEAQGDASPASPTSTHGQDGTMLQNILAGFSTAMAALPDAISFSFITGVSPLNGIWAGVFMGLSAALVGGRPGMISSASAATAVVLADISTDPEFGRGFMALTVFVVGILQFLIGLFRLSRFITMVPHPVMLGFVNGLAIVMIEAQMRQYHVNGSGPWVPKEDIVGMTITALFAMAAAVVWSRIQRVSSWLPAPLASVILTTIFAIVCESAGMSRRTLKDVAGAETFAGGRTTLPSWDFPPVGVEWHDGAKLLKVFSIAVRFAIVGILESLMTLALIDQITGTQGSGRSECFGQSLGNILSSFFGLQGGCALIAQSLMNVGSGGRTRLSGVVMAITLGACVVILAPVMSQIPVAALVGLITLIALNTFAWGSLELILRVDWIDAIVVVIVTVVTVWKDLAIAVLTGIIISGLGFAWHAATEVIVDINVDDEERRWFAVKGPLFFGSAMNYRTAICTEPFGEGMVVLCFKKARVLDVSGVDAVAKTVEHLLESGKSVGVRGLRKDIIEQLAPEVQCLEDLKPPEFHRLHS